MQKNALLLSLKEKRLDHQMHLYKQKHIGTCSKEEFLPYGHKATKPNQNSLLDVCR